MKQEQTALERQEQVRKEEADAEAAQQRQHEVQSQGGVAVGTKLVTLYYGEMMVCLERLHEMNMDMSCSEQGRQWLWMRNGFQDQSQWSTAARWAQARDTLNWWVEGCWKAPGAWTQKT